MCPIEVSYSISLHHMTLIVEVVKSIKDHGQQSEKHKKTDSSRELKQFQQEL